MRAARWPRVLLLVGRSGLWAAPTCTCEGREGSGHRWRVRGRSDAAIQRVAQVTRQSVAGATAAGAQVCQRVGVRDADGRVYNCCCLVLLGLRVSAQKLAEASGLADGDAMRCRSPTVTGRVWLHRTPRRERTGNVRVTRAFLISFQLCRVARLCRGAPVWVGVGVSYISQICERAVHPTQPVCGSCGLVRTEREGCTVIGIQPARGGKRAERTSSRVVFCPAYLRRLGTMHVRQCDSTWVCAHQEKPWAHRFVDARCASPSASRSFGLYQSTPRRACPSTAHRTCREAPSHSVADRAVVHHLAAQVQRIATTGCMAPHREAPPTKLCPREAPPKRSSAQEAHRTLREDRHPDRTPP